MKQINVNEDILLLSSETSWEKDKKNRFDLEKLNSSFRSSVPVLDFLDWQITDVHRGYAETKLPINTNSSNQYITHQAALMLLSADYTGGLALASILDSMQILGFWEVFNNKGVYMWGALAKIKWIYPSCEDLICRAKIDKNDWVRLYRRVKSNKKIVFTVKIEMFNHDRLVAESYFTYWAQNVYGLQKDAFDLKKISVLYEHKTKTTAKLIAGIRALEHISPRQNSKFKDELALKFAGKHGITLAKRFQKIIPQIKDMIYCRTIVLDEAVLNFAKKHSRFNVVNIGSGYDTRFLRILVDGVQIYDLDLPIMLNDRSKYLSSEIGVNIHLVPFDIIKQDISNVLVNDKSNFDLTLPTFFIWEGGSMYFTNEEIEKLFKSIRALMNNESYIWFDYVDKKIIDGRVKIPEIDNFLSEMRKMGEVFITGLDNIDLIAKKHNLEVYYDKKCSSINNIDDPTYFYYNFALLKN